MPAGSSSVGELQMKKLIKYWLIVLMWMVLIFIASTDVGAGDHTSRYIQPFLHWLFPKMSRADIGRTHILIRKIGHLSEYAVLAVLVWRALVKPQRWTLNVWCWRFVAMARVRCCLYAA